MHRSSVPFAVIVAAVVIIADLVFVTVFPLLLLLLRRLRIQEKQGPGDHQGLEEKINMGLAWAPTTPNDAEKENIFLSSVLGRPYRWHRLLPQLLLGRYRFEIRGCRNHRSRHGYCLLHLRLQLQLLQRLLLLRRLW